MELSLFRAGGMLLRAAQCRGFTPGPTRNSRGTRTEVPAKSGIVKTSIPHTNLNRSIQASFFSFFFFLNFFVLKSLKNRNCFRTEFEFNWRMNWIAVKSGLFNEFLQLILELIIE